VQIWICPHSGTYHYWNSRWPRRHLEIHKKTWVNSKTVCQIFTTLPLIHSNFAWPLQRHSVHSFYFIRLDLMSDQLENVTLVVGISQYVVHIIIHALPVLQRAILNSGCRAKSTGRVAIRSVCVVTPEMLNSRWNFPNTLTQNQNTYNFRFVGRHLISGAGQCRTVLTCVCRVWPFSKCLNSRWKFPNTLNKQELHVLSVYMAPFDFRVRPKWTMLH